MRVYLCEFLDDSDLISIITDQLTTFPKFRLRKYLKLG